MSELTDEHRMVIPPPPAEQGPLFPSAPALQLNTHPLDGVRLIAAYMVFIYHWIPYPPGFISHFTCEFDSGVSIFFVLSGFLITLLYGEKASLTPSWLSYYYTRRFARIMPMYLLIALVSLILEKNHDRFYWFIQLTLLKGFSCEYFHTLVPQAWSLTVEFTFYTVAPFLFVFCTTRKRLIYSVFFIALAGAILNLACEPHYFHGFFCSSAFMLMWTFFGRYFEFFAGIYMARFIVKEGAAYNKKYGRFTHKTYLALLGCLVLMVIESYVDAGFTGKWPYLLIQFLLHHVTFPILVAIVLLGLMTENSPIASLLQSKPVKLMGRASYTFFLLNIGVITRRVSGLVGNDLLLLFVVNNFIALLTFLAVEQPIREYMKQI
jgi:peptidoglycan/LPS O-acetylase OafA/YrhL